MRASFPLAIALAAVVACGDDVTGPASVNGRYTLRLIEGQPLPFLMIESRTTEHMGSGSVTIREYVDGATLVLLEPEGDTLRITRRAVVTPDGGPITTTTTVEQRPYYLDDDRLCIPEFSPVGGCPEGQRVPRRGDSLFIELRAFTAGEPVTFTFVREGR